MKRFHRCSLAKTSFAGILCFFLTACVSITSPQLNYLYSIILPKKQNPPLDQFKWRLQYGEYTTDVYLASLPQGLFFVSENDDVLFLADNIITQVYQLAGETYKITYDVDIKSKESDKSIINHNVTFDNAVSYPDGSKKQNRFNQFKKDDVIIDTYECSVWVEENNKRESNSKIRVKTQICHTPQGTIENTQHFLDNKLVYIKQWYASLAVPLILDKKQKGKL